MAIEDDEEPEGVPWHFGDFDVVTNGLFRVDNPFPDDPKLAARWSQLCLTGSAEAHDMVERLMAGCSGRTLNGEELLAMIVDCTSELFDIPARALLQLCSSVGITDQIRRSYDAKLREIAYIRRGMALLRWADVGHEQDVNAAFLRELARRVTRALNRRYQHWMAEIARAQAAQPPEIEHQAVHAEADGRPLTTTETPAPAPSSTVASVAAKDANTRAGEDDGAASATSRPIPPRVRRWETINRKQKAAGFYGHGSRSKFAQHLGVSYDTLRGFVAGNVSMCGPDTAAWLRLKIPITDQDDWPDLS